jgi:hypothetical protein
LFLLRINEYCQHVRAVTIHVTQPLQKTSDLSCSWISDDIYYYKKQAEIFYSSSCLRKFRRHVFPKIADVYAYGISISGVLELGSVQIILCLNLLEQLTKFMRY